MRRKKVNALRAAAVATSAGLHVIFLIIGLSQISPVYHLPEFTPPPEPPMDARIIVLETPPPPLKIEPRKTPTPPKPPEPPLQPEPKPEPPKPEPQKPEPQKLQAAAVEKAKPAPPKVQPVLAPAPLPAAKPVVTPPAPKPTPPAPPAPLIKAPPLNVHKPEKDAPKSVPALPMAPSPVQPSANPPLPATVGGGAAPGDSRLSGLRPFPTGMFPSGGPGLRGTLVGCANADAVRLTPAEREKCNRRFSSELSRAPALDGIDPAKRAAFDRSVEHQDAARAYRGGTSSPTARPEDPAHGVPHGPGSSVILPTHDGQAYPPK